MDRDTHRRRQAAAKNAELRRKREKGLKQASLFIHEHDLDFLDLVKRHTGAANRSDALAQIIRAYRGMEGTAPHTLSETLSGKIMPSG